MQLPWHALRNGLKRSGRRSIAKIHGKEGFKQVWEEPDGAWAFSKTKFCFERGKVYENLANMPAELPIGFSCRVTWIEMRF